MVDKVFVLVPAYNAGATVEKVFARIPSQAKKRIRKYVAVNDGRKDNTAEALIRCSGNFQTWWSSSMKSIEGTARRKKYCCATRVRKTPMWNSAAFRRTVFPGKDSRPVGAF